MYFKKLCVYPLDVYIREILLQYHVGYLEIEKIYIFETEHAV